MPGLDFLSVQFHSVKYIRPILCNPSPEVFHRKKDFKLYLFAKGKQTNKTKPLLLFSTLYTLLLIPDKNIFFHD